MLTSHLDIAGGRVRTAAAVQFILLLLNFIPLCVGVVKKRQLFEDTENMHVRAIYMRRDVGTHVRSGANKFASEFKYSNCEQEL